LCIKITKCQNAYQINVYFFQSGSWSVVPIVYFDFFYKHEKHFSAFSFDHLQCFLGSILSGDLSSDVEKITETANEN